MMVIGNDLARKALFNNKSNRILDFNHKYEYHPYGDFRVNVWVIIQISMQIYQLFL
jgi:hypothetical protein